MNPTEDVQLYRVAAAGFEAARAVPGLPEGHRCRGLHGHSFLARVRAAPPREWEEFPGAASAQLHQRLEQVVRPLDYRLLNDTIEVPNDENVARWIRDGLDAPGIESLRIQSAAAQGIDLDRRGHAHAWRRFRFEAAHRLPNVPPGHQCGRMHGHGFEVILHVDQGAASGSAGGVEALEALWAPLEAELHLACLNDIPGLENPTSEVLAAWIWMRLKPLAPALSWVTVLETRTSGCHYDGASYRIWKEQHFESAVALGGAPPGDPRRRLHGHSYRIRLHLTAPLDDVLGWTVDYGDVKERFQPVLAQLDHCCLNELEGVRDGDLAGLLHWVRDRMGQRLPELDRIDLDESPGCGAVLCWGARGPALPT
jgi:6-pyruvoyltetrahydropterin/6-carboxytetrahydropterin synthase